MNLVEEQGLLSNQIKEYLTDFDKLTCGVAIAKNDDFCTVVKANPYFYQLIGHTKEDFQTNKNNSMDNIVVDNVQILKDKIIKEKKYDIHYNIRVRTANNTVVWLNNTVHYDKKLDVFYFILVDTTDRLITTANHLSYESFLIRNEILTYLGMYSSQHITVTDILTDKVMYINESAQKLFGFNCEADWLNKPYCEIGFGSKENVHPSYYDLLENEDFTVREYYNTHHKMYWHVESKILKVPEIKRKLCLNIITDITDKIKLEQSVALQKALHQCVDSLFNSTTNNRVADVAYEEVLTCLKDYYGAQRAFFYIFKKGTYEVDNYYYVCCEGVDKLEYTSPIIFKDYQMELIQAISDVKNSQQQTIFDALDDRHRKSLLKLYEENQIDNFTTVVIKDRLDTNIGFIGVVNPQMHEDNKEIMELLSRFICMFIEHQKDQQVKDEAIKVEAISKMEMVQRLSTNFKSTKKFKENIEDTLNTLCLHYDADFAAVLVRNEDGTCSPSYIGGNKVPNLSLLQNHLSLTMDQWVKLFENKEKFISDVHSKVFKESNHEAKLHKKLDIYNYIASPIKNSDDIVVGLLFVNNFKLLNRSHLMVHVVANGLSEYFEKMKLYKKNQLDPLTKLLNKVVTEKKIKKLLKKGSKGTLFVIDVDYFKEVNDTLGHSVGDQVLIDLASKLKQMFRSTDIIGRLGGDEFMVYCPGIHCDELIESKTKRLLYLGKEEYEKNDLKANVSLSIGVCKVHKHCNTFQCLYEKADEALYVSKRQGKNRYYIYK